MPEDGVLRNVLLVDDTPEDFGNAVDEFKSQGIEVSLATSLDEALEFLESGASIDAVVLDWYLESPDSSIQSLVFLKKLRERKFLPVLVWTFHKDRFECPEDFPSSCITAEDKRDVVSDRLVEFARQWYDASVPARLAEAWRRCLGTTAEKVLYDLAVPREESMLAALAKWTDGKKDIEHSVDLLSRLLVRHVCSNQVLRKRLEPLLNRIEDISETSLAGYGSIKHREMYYDPKDKVIRTGDIVKWQTASGSWDYGVVLTPACDLANKRTCSLRLVGLRKLADSGLKVDQRKQLVKAQMDGYHFLPFALDDDGQLRHLVARFLDLVDLTLATKGDAGSVAEDTWEKPPSVLQYSDTFIGHSGTVVLVRICRLDDPYRSQLIHRFTTHAGRVGVPDMPGKVRKKLHEIR